MIHDSVTSLFDHIFNIPSCAGLLLWQVVNLNMLQLPRNCSNTYLITFAQVFVGIMALQDRWHEGFQLKSFTLSMDDP